MNDRLKFNRWGEEMKDRILKEVPTIKAIPHEGTVNALDKPMFENKKDLAETTIKGDKYLMIKLEEGQTVETFKQEVSLIKAVFGRSNNDMTEHLNDHIKKCGSIIGI